MSHFLIGCHSDAPDRAHDAVVLAVDEPLLESLSAKRRAFETQSDVSLHAHEYSDSNVFYFRFDGEDDHVNSLGHPSEPVNLDEWLCGWGVLGPYHLEDAPNVYLKVVAEGFFYTWDGRTEKHGPSEIYETDVFTVEQLEGLCRAVA